MKQVKRNKKQNKDVSREIQVMLKRAVNTHVPVIIDTPPVCMNPKMIHLTQDELDLYNFEMINSNDKNITPIAQAKDNIRFNRAVNAFRQAGIPANTYTHIGYYQIPQEEDESEEKAKTKKYRYILLW